MWVLSDALVILVDLGQAGQTGRRLWEARPLLELVQLGLSRHIGSIVAGVARTRFWLRDDDVFDRKALGSNSLEGATGSTGDVEVFCVANHRLRYVLAKQV